MKKFVAGSLALGLLVFAPVNVADACTINLSKSPVYRVVLSDEAGQKREPQVRTYYYKGQVFKVARKTAFKLTSRIPRIVVSKVNPISIPVKVIIPTPEPTPVTEITPTPVTVPVQEPEPTTPTPTPTPIPEPVPKEEFSAMQVEMLNYINAERAKAGKEALVLDQTLSEGAYLKSKDMAVNNYFSHTSPTYGSPFAMMKDMGISYRLAAENIARNTSVKGAHDAFMNSSGHRANILNGNFSKIGIGFYQEGHYLYVTQWFTN